MQTRAFRAMVMVWLAVLVGGSWVAAQEVPQANKVLPSQIDKVFERWDRPGSPGCAVGVDQHGKVVYTQGYGMANLEYGIRIRPETIFESGSVAKQFTAAAIALLVQDGKLSLGDPVRKYVPELPDFGVPITIQHFLNHTSGIRSQWPLLTLAGRPPGKAVHTIDEILELVSREKELNFKPGDEYLYNNTAFVLLGVIVERASGKPFAEFSQERLFRPLGMTQTRWRTDFTAIVENRATAYSRQSDGSFRTNMSFTNVYGNGGLLTTVGDLLIWNENLDTPRVGGRAMVDQLQTRGRLNDGFENEYAQGLSVSAYRGVREISHSGSTAGYQTFLSRFPDDHLSVAVLCNTTGTAPTTYAHEVADLFLGAKLKEVVKPTAAPVALDVLQKLAGVYRDPHTDAVLRLVYDADKKTLGPPGATGLVPTGAGRFSTQNGAMTFTVERPDSSGPTRLVQSDGRSKPVTWVAEAPFAPTPEQLASYAGDYYSDEIDTLYHVRVEKGALVARFRPAMRVSLLPVFTDGFEGDGNVLRFTREASSGRIDGFRVYAGRVRHLKFVRR
ncbi:MAG: beta-lactamase family protein [Planctomycetes bacterium]|nr:beta-lactamase family protein [Planctomycetota bacterium]